MHILPPIAFPATNGRIHRQRMLQQSLALVCMLLSHGVWAQDTASDNGSNQLEFIRPQGTAGATLRLVAADGQAYEQRYGANQSLLLSPHLNNGQALRDGQYHWEIYFAPHLNAEQQQSATQRAEGPGDESVPTAWPLAATRISGNLFISGGQFLAETQEEVSQSDPFEPPPRNAPDGPGTNDQVIADDLIVQGSACVGTDCINNENFGFDTLRLKENNTRIGFQDTSTGAFPSNDWELTANDSASGGLNHFSIRDVDANRNLVTIEATAPSNSLYIANNGNLGLGTSIPNLDLHITNGNTPAMRLEQDATNGFSPQTWDVAGNEAGFFIRDVTSSSTLPFRVLPGGAPTNSLVVDGQGDVGSGLVNPSAALHIRRANNYAQSWLLLDRPSDGDANTEERLLEVDSSGNLFAGGSITQLSSRTAKENFSRVVGQQVLNKLTQLPLWTWNYLSHSAADRHIGPVAEDFYAAFGFGQSERSLAPADLAGVALAATQALQAEIATRDAHIASLEERLARLETLLDQPQQTSANAQASGR